MRSGERVGAQIGDPVNPMTENDELLKLLRAVHRSVAAELLTLKHEVRERVSRIQALERRLFEIEQSQAELTGE
jgi:hypothetical protein